MVLPKKPDVLEWCVDFFEKIAETASVITAATAIKKEAGGMPLLFTRRSTMEGGENISLNEAQVIALYSAVCESKTIDLIDYELANDPANNRGRKGHRPPLPPNRACGSPAHGSPVSGFLIGIGSLGGLLPW